MTCHYGIELLAETPRFCTANQYQTHHYHYKTDHYQCCGCSYTIQATFNPPLVSLDLLGRLAATRPNYQTLADRISQPDKILPTLETTFTAALQFTKDLIKGSRRDINSRNVNLEIKLGVDPASIELLNLLGFELKDSFFIAPSEAYVTVNKDRLLRIQHELALFLESCRSPTNNTALDISSANPLIAEWVGVNEILEPTTGRQVETFRLFGTIPTAKDDLVIWLYQMVLKEHPNDSAMYLDCLIDAANLSRSNLLLTEVALERSRGKVGYKEIREACENFDIKQDVAVDDRLLTELYRIKVSDEPHNKNKHRDHLKVIAIARRSEALYDFLKDEPPKVHKVFLLLDVFLFFSFLEIVIKRESVCIPVGLNNIGNTCYFNSLLQYYFTLLPLRKTVLNIDSYVENEDDPNWVPKKIGGITVDQHEVRRAKKFVYLLRSLFINLQNTSQRAISPEYDLAYMALLNEKDVEEAAAEAAAEAVASVSASAVEASSTPIESLQTIDQQNTKEKEAKEVYKFYYNKNLNPPTHTHIYIYLYSCFLECMDNVTYLIEAALKPVETQDGEQVRDMVRDLFYGKARQILTYQDTQTSQNIKKIKEEEFSHLIVDAAQGKDLYDGLDEYFFADQVENFQGGREATREVTVSTFPPVLQIIVQRVQFDRATANVYKSNAFIQFEKIIYLDRYADRNFDSLAEKRAEVTNWRKEEEIHKAKIDELINNKASKSCENKGSLGYAYQIPVPDMLEATANILEIQMAQQPQNAEQHEAAIQFLLKEAREARETIQESTCAIEVLRSKIKNQYSSLTKDAYRIHAVFIHQGQANYGHYWVYMYDKPTDQWWKYNDSHVTKVEEAELFRDTSGSTANPYFLVYVREEDSDALVETVAKKEIPHVLSAA
ncbi:hypothetical protein F4703DRAFT_1746442 [Phycomyces blakesleeanus]